MKADFSVSRRLLKFGLATVLGSGFALAGAGQAHAAAFTAGNLVVYRVGDGTAALSAVAASVFLDEYTPSGTLVQSIALPTTVTTTGNRALTAAGSATSEGFLNRSVDGTSLVLTGYNAAPTTAALAATTSAAVNRVVGVVSASGSMDTTTALTDTSFSGSNIRSVASLDGTNLYVAGTATAAVDGGIRFATKGSNTSSQLSTVTTNIRTVSIYPTVNGTDNQLYVSAASGATRVAQVGTGVSNATAQPINNITAAPASPYAFVLLDLDPTVPGADTLYVANDSAGTGIQKYSYSGGAFNLNGTIAATSVRGLTASVSGTTVNLYATAGSSSTLLLSVSDTAGYNAAPSTTTLTAANTIVTAASNTAFRGIAFAPAATSSVATTGAIISEFRERGSAGTEDEYIELYNTTTNTLDISGWKLTYTGGGTTQTITIPASTTLTPLGHYLIVNNTATTGYSLANYGGTGLAAGNQTYTTGIDDGSTLTLFNAATTPVAQDTVTFGAGGLVAPTTNGQYAFVRQPNLTTSLPVTTANAFNFVSTTAGTFGTAASALGAPGPENLTSPKALLALRVSLLDAGVGSGVSPNRVRNSAAMGTNAAAGTISIRRLITNNTGAAVSRLRFRIVNLTTLNSSGYSTSTQADLRGLASGFMTQSVTTSTGAVTVFGTTPDTSIAQTAGGGINSSSVETTSGTVILSTPLAATGAGSTRAYDFTFGVQRVGTFTILILFEEASTTAGTTGATPIAQPGIVPPVVVPPVTRPTVATSTPATATLNRPR